MNPIYGSVGLLWSGSWQLCQAAVEAVLKGAPITPITSEAATHGRGPPLKAYDIRHVSKDENSAASNELTQQRVKTRSRKRSSLAKPKLQEEMKSGNDEKRIEFGSVEEVIVNRAGSHESSISHQSEAVNAAVVVDLESKESESMASVETAETSMNLFRDEPEPNRGLKGIERTGEENVGLELTLGLEPVSRVYHVVPVKKRRVELKDCGGGSWNVELGLQYPV